MSKYLALASLFICVEGSKKPSNLEDLYAAGKSAYLENDWQKCVETFEAAIKGYKAFIDLNIKCRRQCNSTQDRILTHGTRDEELVFYERKILSTLCLLRCKFADGSFVSQNEFMSKDQLFLYESLEPYNYLQLCYFQV